MAKATQPQSLRAIALAALQHYAVKEGDRDQLADGSSHDVALAIEGTVDGEEFADAVLGRLKINHEEETASSSAIPPNIIVGYLLSQIPSKRRRELIEILPDQYLQAGRLEVDEELVAAAARLLTRLRTKVTQTRRGSVRFEPAASL
jgi:hypothetical protein